MSKAASPLSGAAAVEGAVAVAGRRRSHSMSMVTAAPRRPPPPRKSSVHHDEEIGHFCYPDLPGFCEANFCIFHAPSAPKADT